MRGNVSRNVSNNEELSRPSFIMSPWLVKKTCIHSDPGGKQCYFGRDSDKRPTPLPYPLVYIKAGEEHSFIGTVISVENI